MFRPDAIEGDFTKKEGPDVEPGNIRTSDVELRNACDAGVRLFCKEFVVYGKDRLENFQEQNPDSKFIIISSHNSNLDAPAAVKALGDRVDIQITAESGHFRDLPRRFLFAMAGGKEKFSPLDYKKEGILSRKNRHGVFNPKNFEELSEKMQRGKTPWMAISPRTDKEITQSPKIGAVYLAHKTGAIIIPTALSLEGGGSANLKGLGIVKGLAKKGNAAYHIGEPINLPPIDVSIIESVFEKRSRGEKVSREEIGAFRGVHKLMKEQAGQVAEIIAAMLRVE